MKPPVIMAGVLRDAVIKAANAQNGDTVVLSPACASFDMFDNFEQRGIKYKSGYGAGKDELICCASLLIYAAWPAFLVLNTA